MITTGGTISCREFGEKRTRDVVERDFNNLVGRDLAEKGIAISGTYSAYKILSENINFDYIEKLVDKILEIINTENSRPIVITHGTDSLDKVIDLLIDLEFGLSRQYPGINGALVEKVNFLWDELHEKEIALVFTAVNDSNEEIDIKPSLKKACEYASIEGLEPGLHLSFYDGQFLICGAVDTMADYLRPGVYDPNQGMRFVKGGDLEFQLALRKHLDYTDQMIRKLADKFEAKISLEHMSENTKEVKVYDLTRLRAHHNEFRESLDVGTKGIIFVMNHGSTANAPDPSSDEYREELSVEKLVRDMKEEYPGLKFFAVTENYEAVDLSKYASSVRIRDAGVVSMQNCPKELAIAKLKILANKDFGPDELERQMLDDKIGEMN